MLLLNSSSQAATDTEVLQTSASYPSAPATYRPRWTTRADMGHALVEIAPAEGATRRHWGVAGLTVELLELRAGQRVDLRLRSTCHVLAVYEQGSRREGETAVAYGPRSTLRSFERKLTFLPSGAEYTEWMVPKSATRILFVHIDPLAGPSRPAPDIAAGAPTPRLFFEDAALWATVMKLKRLVENPVNDNQLYFGALGVVLTHELDRLGRENRTVEPIVRGGLAPWQQRAVATYIEEHLGEPVRLAELAGVARLSPFYFCRAFKQSFGQPPHHYHTGRRIERAKTLLSERHLSVTEIGLGLGYSESSSFATAFRKATGMSPSRFRRNLE